ncbi:hypothetical protein HZC07_03225 [Candidatus Micrarchaeota archaeon]|nr:hypothetical protein [Candidatus Micrarchaeota archaeon]
MAQEQRGGEQTKIDEIITRTKAPELSIRKDAVAEITRIAELYRRTEGVRRSDLENRLYELNQITKALNGMASAKNEFNGQALNKSINDAIITAMAAVTVASREVQIKLNQK